MNDRVYDLTEIALQIMGYQMLDQNGVPTSSLHQIIPAQLNNEPAGADHPSSSQHLDQDFMAKYGVMDLGSVVEDPVAYVERQMQAYCSILNERIMRTKATRFKNISKEMRDNYASEISEDVAAFKRRVLNETMKVMEAVDIAVGADFSQTDDEIAAAYKAKAVEMLDEFNMLLDLLKYIVDDMPNDWRMLEKLLLCLKSVGPNDF